MIKRLRRKFVLIAMGSFLLVTAIIIGSINAANMIQANNRVDGLLTLLSDNDGNFPKDGKDKPPKPGRADGFQMTPETPFETRYFIVKTDQSQTITQIDTGHIAAVSSSQAREYAQDVLAGGKAAGYYGAYKYQVTQTDYGQLVVFLDCGTQLRTNFSVLIISCGIGLVSLLVVFLLVSIFSKRAIRPVVESMEKQKQFITDAGHEIKTPLAIISANTDVLELNSGQSEWTESIRNQTKRLNELVKSLLALSKMEEGQAVLAFSQFSISDMVWETASPFQILAETQGKRFELNVQPGLLYYGDAAGIRQLVSILADNAVKYADEHGEVQVSLSRSGKAVKLEVYNTSDNIPQGQLDKLFDRFYRGDSSRARETGGYGIGLSIAKAIVQAHKGKIFVSSQDGASICFTVIL